MATNNKTKNKTTTKAAVVSTMNKNLGTTNTKATKTYGSVTHDQIAERAYKIYLSGRGGNSTDHWLEAERELTSERR